MSILVLPLILLFVALVHNLTQSEDAAAQVSPSPDPPWPEEKESEIEDTLTHLCVFLGGWGQQLKILLFFVSCVRLLLWTDSGNAALESSKWLPLGLLGWFDFDFDSGVCV